MHAPWRGIRRRILLRIRRRIVLWRTSGYGGQVAMADKSASRAARDETTTSQRERKSRADVPKPDGRPPRKAVAERRGNTGAGRRPLQALAGEESTVLRPHQPGKENARLDA